MPNELQKFIADPRYSQLTPEERADAFRKLEPRFGQLPEPEREKFIGMMEGKFRMPAGSEQTGLPPAATFRPPQPEEIGGGTVGGEAQDTFRGVGRGAINVLGGLTGGGMRYAGEKLGSETLAKGGKAVTDAAQWAAQPPKYLQLALERPDWWQDPAAIANLASEGVGSTVPFLATGGVVGGVAAKAARLPIGAWRTAAGWAAGSATGAVLESMADAGAAFNEAVDVHKASPEAAARVFEETMKREVPVTLVTNAAGEFLPRMGGSLWKRAMQVGIDAMAEGVEEVGQGVAQRSAKNEVLGTDTPLMEGAGQEFVGGALGGGVVSGVRAGIEGVGGQQQQGEQDVATDPEIAGYLPVAQQRQIRGASPGMPSRPGRPIAGDLPPGRYDMPAARGNRNPVGEQGPFQQPGDAPIIDAEFEVVAPRQIEGGKRRMLAPPSLQAPRGRENPIPEQGPFYGGDVGDRARPMPGQGLPQLGQPGPIRQGPANLRRIEAGGKQEKATTPGYNDTPLQQAEGRVRIAREKRESFMEDIGNYLDIPAYRDQLDEIDAELRDAAVSLLEAQDAAAKQNPLLAEQPIGPKPGIRTATRKPEPEPPAASESDEDDDTPKLHIPREQNSVVASVMMDLNGDRSIELERIGERAYGGKRTSGAFTKRQIYEAQEAGMNAWMRDNSKHILAKDPKEAIGYLRTKTKQLATQTVRDDEQVRKQQFSTPPALAYLAQKVAGVTKDDSVLEPSGGTGGLVSLVLPVAKNVHLNEIDPERAALARQIGFESQSAHDGEVLNALLDTKVKPSVVIMNPPFSAGALKAGGKGADRNRTQFGYNHVEQALQRLAPGGRLVAILSGGMEGRGEGSRFGAPVADRFWQRMSQHYNIRANVGIPGKEYSKYGTSFPTRVVVIDKTGATPGGNWLAQVAQAVKGDCDSIESAWDALAGIAADRRSVAADPAPSGDGKSGTGVAADHGGVQQPDGTRAGTTGADRPTKGARSGQRSPRPDAQVRSGDNPQPDRTGEPEAESPPTGEDGISGRSESPVQQSDGLTGAAGLTPEQLIAQVTANIDAKRNPKPSRPPKSKLQQKAAGAAAKRDERKAKLTGPPAAPAANPLKDSADAAKQRLRDKMRGSQLNAGIDPQDLIDIATIGAEKMLDGSTKFQAWAKSMREDVGDLIDWMAKTTKQTAEKVLRTIHTYARQVAKNFGIEVEEAPAEPEGDVAIRRRQKRTAQEDAGAFVIYEPTLEGKQHPGAIVESRSMATVSLPPLTYEPKLTAGVKISAVQLESVVIAGQQNERRNGDGSRGAALIGDGTGVGKGRTVAAILWDNWNQGRKRLVWVSEKWDLIKDSGEYLEAVGAKHLADSLVPLNKLDNKGTIDLPEGVIFTTYDLIRSKDKSGNTSLATLTQWLKGTDEAEGAFVAFDEAHEMKNTVPGGRAVASQMGVATKKLRDDLPNLRTVFMSATSATEVENMGYLERLGLWGPRTAFPNGFTQFVNEVGSGGIATMELIARELKATGKYLARTLSYKGVRYEEVTAELNADQREIYRAAAGAWRTVTKAVEEAIKTINGGKDARAQFSSQYWSANQRFFNLLLTALKTPAAIELAERGLESGKSVVITLQNTNEAAQNRQEAKLKNEESEGDADLDFGPKDILINLVSEHYPTQQWVDEIVTDASGKQKVKKVPLTRKDETGKDVPVQNPQAIAERDALIERLDRELHIPANPLDILIEHFGRNNVAELTGRGKYYDQAIGEFKKRGGDLPRKQVNIAEAQAFQDGTKRVAILSQAAGTGISLHASNDEKNQQQRWHITLQAGWSADKAMQMLGRTHRTNQKQTPHYFTLVSDMSGEKRFLATIAKRMGSLGALTRGDSEASGGADMSNVNFESQQGQQAATAFVMRLQGGQQIPGVDMDGFSVLRQMGLTKMVESGGVQQEVVADNAADIRRILNRLLALDPDIQQKVFEYYYQIFESAVRQAVEDGTLDTGVKELRGDSISVDEQRVLSADPETGAETFYYKVTVNTKASVTSVEALDKQMARYPDSTIWVNANTQTLVLGREAEPIVSANGQVREAVRVISPASDIWTKRDRPVITDRSVVLDLDTLIEREVKKADDEVRISRRMVEGDKDRIAMYEKSIGGVPGWMESERARHVKELAAVEKTLADWKAREADRLAWARELWEKQYEATPKTTAEEYHLIGGAVLRWWTTVRANSGIRLAKDSKTGERVVGAVIDPSRIQGVISQIGGGRVLVSASQVYTDVLRNGTEFQLERGVRLRRGRVSRDSVVQVTVPDQQTGRLLIDLGVIYERGVTPVYYIPNGNQATSILDRLLAQYPPAVEGASSTADRVLSAIEAVGDRPASLPRIREQFAGVSKPEFDTAVLALADEGVVTLTRHDHGHALPEEEQAQLVRSEEPDTAGTVRQGAAHSPYTLYAAATRTSRRRPVSADRQRTQGGFLRIDKSDLDKVRAPWDVLFGSMGARIAKLDAEYGTRLRESIAKARNNGDVIAGVFLNRLIDAKLPKLTRAERFLLLDVLEGRAKQAPQKVIDAYRVVRQLTNSAAQMAQGLGVQVRTSQGKQAFVPMSDYFPHVFRRAEEYKSGPVRKDVLENMVRIGASPNERHAAAFLGHYIAYMEGGKIHVSLLQWLVKTKQATDLSDARAKLLKYRKLTGSHGSLEYAREMNLPFYDPDPARVLPWHFATAGERLAQIAEFGQHDEGLKQQLEVLLVKGGAATHDEVKAWMERTLRPGEPQTKQAALARAIRAAMTWKLGLAFIPNATQAALNIPPAGDVRALFAGYKALFSDAGRRFAIESGAAIDPVLAEAHQDLGGGRLGRFADWYMRPMQVVEQHNRIVAAAAGADFAQRLFERAKGSPLKSKRVRVARKRLGEMGIDVAASIGRGSLTRADLLMAGKVFSDITQFRNRPEFLPEAASTTWGKVVWQFKTFAYQQARYMVDRTLGELRKGNIGDATFNLLWLAVVGGGLGELVRLLRNMLSAREDDTQGWERFAKNIASAGAAGMMIDAWEALERKDASRLAPPAAGTAADLVRALGAWLDGTDEGIEAMRKFYLRHGPGGQVVRNFSDGQ